MNELQDISTKLSDKLTELTAFYDFMEDDISELVYICGATATPDSFKAEKSEVVSLKLAHFQIHIQNCIKELNNISKNLIRIVDKIPA